MKRFLIIVLIIALMLTGAAIIVLMINPTLILQFSAVSFLDNARSGAYNDASFYMTDEYFGELGYEGLEKLIEDSGIYYYEDVTWEKKEMEGTEGYLEGYITTIYDDEIPIRFDMQSKNFFWYINDISGPEGAYEYDIDEPDRDTKESDNNTVTVDTALSTDTDSGEFTEYKEDIELQVTSLLVAEESGTQHVFYDALSKRKRSETKPREFFKTAFNLRGVPLTTSTVATMDPVIQASKSILNGDGVMFTGYYPTDPLTYFEISFVTENNMNKLYNIRLYTAD